ncbi:hypothetical protein BDP27DRAFT_1403545 [Rhodocollybia butyracea]|uniref:Uncharacterized protein n=1 Tax=Rhodocollybia butyracea TaxID=206335 RepID=A0A9P5PRB6_9AGAR|nr:hypothetical protein BDP27DRAFT_1403545 [Rhodocollybia butyracea]
MEFRMVIYEDIRSKFRVRAQKDRVGHEQTTSHPSICQFEVNLALEFTSKLKFLLDIAGFGFTFDSGDFGRQPVDDLVEEAERLTMFRTRHYTITAVYIGILFYCIPCILITQCGRVSSAVDWRDLSPSWTGFEIYSESSWSFPPFGQC